MTILFSQSSHRLTDKKKERKALKTHFAPTARHQTADRHRVKLVKIEHLTAYKEPELFLRSSQRPKQNLKRYWTKIQQKQTKTVQLNDSVAPLTGCVNKQHFFLSSKS